MRNGKPALWQTNVKSKTNVEIVIISVEKVKMESRDFSLGTTGMLRIRLFEDRHPRVYDVQILDRNLLGHANWAVFPRYKGMLGEKLACSERGVHEVSSSYGPKLGGKMYEYQ
jgi:hypothetical protein